MIQNILFMFLVVSFAYCNVQDRSYQDLRAEKMDKLSRKIKQSKEQEKKQVKKKAKKVVVKRVQEPEDELFFEERIDMLTEDIPAHEWEEEKQVDGDGRYILPAWPSHAYRFKKNDYVRGSVTYKNASKMYDDLGSELSIVAQKFGQKKVTFGQIFLVSKLVNNDIFIPTSGVTKDQSALGYLYDVEVQAEGHYDRVEGVIDYARQFWDNKFVVAIALPIVYQQNTLRYSLDTSSADVKQKIGNDTVIKNNFGGNVDDYFNYLLSLKGFALDQSGPSSRNKTGLGDLSFSFQWNVRDTDETYLAVGAQALLPTAQNQDVSLLWAPQLGNGGFPLFGGFVSAMLLRNEALSPYLHGQITVGASATQLVRVPRRVTYSGIDNKENAGYLSAYVKGREYAGPNYVSGTSGPYRSFDEYDSEIPAFADSFKSVKIAPGVLFDLMVGNVFSPSFAPGLTFDVFYKVHVKSMSSVRENGYEKGDWALEGLVDNSNRIDHHVGGQIAYQWQEYFRFSCKGGYSFAGRNNPAELQVQLGFSVDF